MHKESWEIEGKTERDFHQDRGHKIPVFIKFVWAMLILWGSYYFIKYSLTAFKSWPS